MSINRKQLCATLGVALIVSTNSFAQTEITGVVNRKVLPAESGSQKLTAISESSAVPAIAFPTLDEIAEAQRLKQRTEIAKIKADAAQAAATAKAVALAAATAEKNAKMIAETAAVAKKTLLKKSTPQAIIPPPTHRLNSVYKINDKWKAEFIEGSNIVTYEIGQRFGDFTVREIGSSSVTLISEKKGQIKAGIGESF